MNALLVAAATAGVVFVGAPLTLYMVGFGAKGVAATSIAAGWQASIGNVAAGSTFSALQSAGVLGVVSAKTGAAITLASSAIPSLYGALKPKPEPKKWFEFYK